MSSVSFLSDHSMLIGAILIGAAIPIGLAIDKKLKNKKEQFCKFDEDRGILYLYKRGAKIRSYIKIREHMNYSFGRTNEQLNFGAATVGGVTTGGFYKTGNDLYVAEEKKSGHYDWRML